jgi:HSP20 family molecular chaperone IbpA
LSAKWRRSRNSKKFNIFRVFNKIRDRNDPQTFQTKGSRVKRQSYPYRYRVQKASAQKKLREPRPLVDVLEGNDDVVVVAEFAGFKKEDLRINVKNQRLTLSAEAFDRKYHKSLNLPKRVIPSTICTTYKNGVLEIRLKKAAEEKALDNSRLENAT